MNEVNPDRVGIYLDVLENILKSLNNNKDLQLIFGIPVSRSLVIVADNNDLRIEDGGKIDLTEEQQQTFLRILDETIKAHSV